MRTDDSNPSPPIFILSDIRSGSTLLRYILDTHPDICSPGELEIGKVCESLHWTIYSTIAKLPTAVTEEQRQEIAYAEVRRIVSDLMNSYTRARNKRIWCEKSPINVRYLSVISQVFPDAKYIFLYRNCMDVVYSKLESHKWGWWTELVPYLMRYPENFIAGLVESWIDFTKAMLTFESENPSKSFRVKYESIVYDAPRTLQPMFEFLGVEWHENLLDSVFTVRHEEGHGDVKVQYAKSIETSFIGKGSNLRRGWVLTHLLDEMNKLLEQLGYPIVGPDWDHAPSPYVNKASTAAQAECESTIGRLFTQYFPDRLREQNKHLKEINAICKIVVADSGEMWMIDMTRDGGRITPGDGKADCTITISAADLIDITSGRLNAGDIYLQGKVRIGGNIFLANRIGNLLFG
jgi:Putative sterol carrier protein